MAKNDGEEEEGEEMAETDHGDGRKKVSLRWQVIARKEEPQLKQTQTNYVEFQQKVVPAFSVQGLCRLHPCESSFPCRSLSFQKMGIMNEVLAFIEYMSWIPTPDAATGIVQQRNQRSTNTTNVRR